MIDHRAGSHRRTEVIDSDDPRTRSASVVARPVVAGAAAVRRRRRPRRRRRDRRGRRWRPRSRPGRRRPASSFSPGRCRPSSSAPSSAARDLLGVLVARAWCSCVAVGSARLRRSRRARRSRPRPSRPARRSSVGSAVSTSSVSVGSSVSTSSVASGVSLASSLLRRRRGIVGRWLPPTTAVVAKAAPAIRNRATSEVPIERIILWVVFIAWLSDVMRALPVGRVHPSEAADREKVSAGGRSPVPVRRPTISRRVLDHRDRTQRGLDERVRELRVVADERRSPRTSGWTCSRATRCTSSTVTASIAARYRVELVIGKAVHEQARERPGDGARGLEPEREHADEEVARGAQLRVLDRRLADPVELAQHLGRARAS